MGANGDHRPFGSDTPATGRLVLFGVRGLERTQMNTGWSAWTRIPGEDSDFALASSGLSFRDSQDRHIAVLTHRKDDQRIPRLRTEAAAHAYYALLRSQGQPTKGPRWPDGAGSPAVPQVDWETATISVDDQPTAFEVCRFDRGHWAAIGRELESDITLTSFGVPLEGLELERLQEVVMRRPPLRPPP